MAARLRRLGPGSRAVVCGSVPAGSGHECNAWLERSPTGLIMAALPVLVALCWVAMLVVLVVG
ncbi:hypothetical protein [Streptomyces sp. NBC_01304]|uniref:hypothetical protein n=1 Tax=Streptomyces sp. NBC_01304 TaxID=2903818 RepID=UPI002E162D5E|nr:hypothetical protein OG430_16900 [Streptomyces sp. NBC_01304]